MATFANDHSNGSSSTTTTTLRFSPRPNISNLNPSRSRQAPKSIMKTNKKRKYTPGGSYISTFTGGSVQKKKNTLFISVPQVHEFQTDSPVTFRLPTSSKKSIEKLDSKACDEVLQVMGKKSIKSPNKKKKAVLKVVAEQFKEKLEYLGIVSPTDDIKELRNRVEFLKKLERQAHLRYAIGEDLTLYSIEELARQLLEKKEKVKRTDIRREVLEDRLAAAMLKESDNFRIGQGYDHGLRFMTTDERLEEYSHKELYTELKTKYNIKKIPRKKNDRREMLYKEVEKACKAQLVDQFCNVLKSELIVRHLPNESKKEMIEYMEDLRNQRNKALKAQAEKGPSIDSEDDDDDDDDEDGGLVSSPSAKRRKISRSSSSSSSISISSDLFDINEKDIIETQAPDVDKHILSIKYLPSNSFLKKASLEQVQFEVLFAYVCLNALTANPSVSLERRSSCNIL